MAYSNYRITAPVSFADVNNALGTRHTDLGNLCTDSHILEWARNKPFICTKVGLITDADRRAAQFGLAKPILSSGSLFNKLASQCMFKTMSNTGNLKGYWEYRKPSGGASSPYRLHDFEGYNSMSTFPVGISIRGSGLTDRGNHEYEMNYNTSPTVSFDFINIPQPHIPLWEFCQTAYNTSYTYPWRVRIDVFADDGSTPWYERSKTEIPSVISDAIPFVANGFTNFWVNVTFPSSLTQNTGKIYYLVIGFQRCDASGGNVSPSGLDNGNGFLPPYNPSNSETSWPFLWKFHLVNYFSRHIKITYGNNTLGYATSSWFTYTAGYFQAGWNSGQLFFVCQISLDSTALTFVNQNGTSGGSGTKIQFAATCPIAHGETLYYAEPSNSSRGSETTVLIPTGSTSAYQTLYMWIDGNIRPSSAGYYTINIMSRTYTGSTPSGNWVNATSISIRITEK